MAELKRSAEEMPLRRVALLSVLQLAVFGAVLGAVLLDDAYIRVGGSHFSHAVLLVGVAGCVGIVAAAGKGKKKYLLLLVTIPATVYVSMLGFLFVGNAI